MLKLTVLLFLLPESPGVEEEVSQKIMELLQPLPDVVTSPGGGNTKLPTQNILKCHDENSKVKIVRCLINNYFGLQTDKHCFEITTRKPE